MLLDLMLPDMDGLSVLTLLKQIDPILPVIMLTAFVEVAKKHRSLTEGAYGYLTKPYDTEELKALIARAVRIKHLSMEAARAKPGQPPRRPGFCADITERRRMEEALRCSQERLRIVVDAALNGIVMVDGSGEIVLANARFEAQFGYEVGGLLGQSADLLIPPRLRIRHPEHQSAFVCYLKPLPSQDRLHIVGARKDGSEFPVSLDITSLMTTNGVYIVATVGDFQGSA